MRGPYLEVTFRHGRTLAAYYYLPRRPGQKSHRAVRIEPGLVIDFARDGCAIGVEITAPSKLSLAALNGVLRRLGFSRLTRSDVAPLIGGRDRRQPRVEVAAIDDR